MDLEHKTKETETRRAQIFFTLEERTSVLAQSIKNKLPGNYKNSKTFNKT